MKASTIFISLECLGGLLTAILGGYIFSVFDTAQLDTSIFLTFTVAFFSMVLGVSVVGYFYLRTQNRLHFFKRAIAFSVVGLFLFIICYILLNALMFSFIPYYLSSVIMPILLPLAGAVTGFNYGLRPQEKVN